MTEALRGTGPGGTGPGVAGLRVVGLRAGYRPGAPVLDDVDLTVAAGTLTALLGPSGCGKSTLLKAVAGLLSPDAGQVHVGVTAVHGTPAERRPVGLLFQKPLLFPHLSVGDNVAFGLRMRGVPVRTRRARAADMLELVELPGAAARRVTELSGGQEQRVALARALVLDPHVLLLDEPFSQLDAALRARMRELLGRLQRELAITTVFVTHDQTEAVEIADTIALMLDGRIEAHAPPPQFFARPPSLASARFFGAANEVPGRLHGTDFDCPLGTLRVAPGGRGGPGVLVMRPESLRLGTPAIPNAVPATVTAVAFRGTHWSVRARTRTGALTLTVTVPPTQPVEQGDQVSVTLPPAACHVLAGEPLDDGPTPTVPSDIRRPRGG